MSEMKYRACAYLRLSREDDDKRGSTDESNSIKSQRMMIESFVRGFPDVELVKEVCDDGFSGTDYERPAFMEMIAMVEKGEIDCIIVKDLSRLGREYIGAGNYIQKYFPQKNVRFIAINDNYDSLTANSSDRYMVVPVKNFVNESYCRDISIKSRSNQQVKRMNGEYIGSFVCYGYRKDEKDKNKIVPDEEAARVVQDIFAWKLMGLSANSIAAKLNERGTLSPAEYKKAHGEKFKTSFQRNPEAKWTPKAVLRILSNEIYIGVLEQGKREKVSYKVKKTIEKPKSQWIRVENNHTPIITEADFKAVQELLKRECTRHSIKVDVLNEIVLGEVRKYVKQLTDTKKLLSILDAKQIRFEEALNRDKEIAMLKEKEQEYSAMKSALYTDLQEKLITQEQFNRYREIYSNKLSEIAAAIKVQETTVKSIYENGIAAGQWLDDLRENMEIEKLDRMLLVSLIDKILVYEDKTVEIVFKYRNEMAKAVELVKGELEAEAMREVS